MIAITTSATTMNRRALSFLTVISTASLMVTFFLANMTANYGVHKNDALSFQAPHLQRRNGTSSPPKAEEGSVPRRNLSEVGDVTINGGRTTQQLQQQQSQEQKDQKENKDNRPSGVVYQYIEPPPINMTARSLLSAQFPNLASLDAASTSTALCGIVKDAEPYLDEWYVESRSFHVELKIMCMDTLPRHIENSYLSP